MARMSSMEAAVRVMEMEGVGVAFGLPGAAINPLHAVMRKRSSVRHILARHVEGASHMAEGYTRARAGNIGVCIGTSGPVGVGAHRASMLQDLEHVRPIELDALLTAVQEMGHLTGVETPYIDAVLALTCQMGEVAGVYPVFPAADAAPESRSAVA